jgi:trimeric autotransporter adhesin
MRSTSVVFGAIALTLLGCNGESAVDEPRAVGNIDDSHVYLFKDAPNGLQCDQPINIGTYVTNDQGIAPSLENPHWTSTNQTVATIDKHGVLTVHVAGTTEIAVQTLTGGGSTVWNLTCTPPDTHPTPKQITFPQLPSPLQCSETYDLKTYLRDESGQPLLPAGMKWKTSADSIATVSVSGILTVSAFGQFTLSAHNDDYFGAVNLQAECGMPPSPIRAVIFEPHPPILQCGQSYNLGRYLKQIDGHGNKQWLFGHQSIVQIALSSSQPDILSITPDGIVTVHKGGSSLLAIAVTDIDGRVFSTNIPLAAAKCGQ